MNLLLIALSVVHAMVLLTIPSVGVVALGLWWNSNTVSHNFIHTPFFRSTVLNRGYSVFLTLLIGIPQSVWRARHMAHHAIANTPPQEKKVAMVETMAVLAMWTGVLWIAPLFFFTVYLPGYAIGLGLCYLHGRFEHIGGTTSHYGFLYNALFLNDGYHIEHHRHPSVHWTRLPALARPGTRASRWPAVLRWIESVNLELLERMVLRSKTLQSFLLRTHERAIRRLIGGGLDEVRTVKIVGGGLFPRTALILRKLLPEARILIVDASAPNLRLARPFLDGRVELHNVMYEPGREEDADLLIIPLSFIGDRKQIYSRPTARYTLVHDWIWNTSEDGVVVSLPLFKRLNMIRR